MQRKTHHRAHVPDVKRNSKHSDLGGWCPLTTSFKKEAIIMTDTVFIPERLKEIREERNLSKAAAARMLNLSKMGYLRYETGDRTPSYQTIVFMAQKLGTSPEYLTGIENTPEPREYIISKTDDPELFALIQDMMDTKKEARTRLLAYYKELKANAMK